MLESQQNILLNYTKSWRSKNMITLLRTIRCWQIRIKWRLAICQFIDKQAMELIKNPEEIEKKFVDSLAKLIHESNMNKSES